MAGEGDKNLVAEFQKLYDDFGKKFKGDPSVLLEQFHKDICFYEGDNPEMVGHQAVLDYMKNFPYIKTNIKVTHAEQLTPNHILCELFEDIVDERGNIVDKVKVLVLFVKEAGKWLELQVAISSRIGKKGATRRANKTKLAAVQEVGDKQLWADIQTTMDGLTAAFHEDPLTCGDFYTVDGRLHPTGQPILIGHEGAGVANITVKKEGWSWNKEDFYLTFAEKLSDEFAMARTNLTFNNAKTGEVDYCKIQLVMKKVDGVWRFHASAW